jgi:2-(1,2-epoxy-1,2-dihydrophenyl)acetyl-CoA isomerase
MTGDQPTPEGVEITQAGGVRRIMLNRPSRRNALTETDRWTLSTALKEADHDPEVRVVVITGSGESFCAGGDIHEFAQERDRISAQIYGLTTAQTVFRALRGMRTPSVARVRGAAAGAGMFLAVGCDIVVADSTAFFLPAHLALGVMPDWGAIWLMPRLVGAARAKAALLTGTRITAETAADWGLIAECTTADQLDERVNWYCQRICSFPSEAIAWTRRGLDQSEDFTLPEFLDWEAQAIAELMPAAEHRDRVAAFLSRSSRKTDDGKADEEAS